MVTYLDPGGAFIFSYVFCLMKPFFVTNVICFTLRWLKKASGDILESGHLHHPLSPEFDVTGYQFKESSWISSVMYSLKLTFSALKINGWKMIFLLGPWDDLFSGAMLVLGSVRTHKKSIYLRSKHLGECFRGIFWSMYHINIVVSLPNISCFKYLRQILGYVLVKF